jgi:ureidoacrylate peracid hydrolase
VVHNSSSSLIGIVIPGGSHHSDLGCARNPTPSSSDSPALVAARAFEEATLRTWVAEAAAARAPAAPKAAWTPRVDFPASSSFALIVVDMQNTFASSGTPSGIGEATKTIEAMRRHAASGRSFVFYTQHGYLNGTSCDGHTEYKRFNDARNDTTQCARDTRGTAEWALVSELSPQSDEPVIQKEQYDAFFATDLHASLQERGVNTVVLVGWETDVCVEGTARGAFARDYRVVVLSDATGTSDGAGIQQSALRIMEKIVADVVPAAVFREALARTLPPMDSQLSRAE